MGVSVLVLVTSPILLLASPYLLYRRLRSNKSEESFDPAASNVEPSHPSSAEAIHQLDEDINHGDIF